MANEVDIRFDVAPFVQALTEQSRDVTQTTEDILPKVVDLVKGKVHPQHEVTGAMRDSIIHESVERKTAGEYVVVIGPTDPASRVVELGHRKGKGRPSYRKPMPWFGPGVEQTRSAIHDFFAEAWGRAVKRGG